MVSGLLQGELAVSDGITIGGVSLEFNPPTSDLDEKLVYGVNQSAIDLANRKMESEGSDWRFMEERRVNGVPVYELKRIWGESPVGGEELVFHSVS